jgi:hypothetical protein
MSLAEVAAGLQGVLEQLARQRAGLAAVLSSTGETYQRLRAVTSGSAHSLLARAIAATAASAERLGAADQQLAGAATAIVEYGRAIGIDLLSPGSGTLPRVTAAPVEAVPDPENAADTPSWLAAAARTLPTRQPKDPTHGVALIGGKQIPMRSGRDSEAAADLKPAYQLIATTTDHVEAKLAARMRRENADEASLLVNNPPCEYTPYGCEQILPRLLPVAARLTVYVRDDDGQVRPWRTYVGNGKAIA